MGQKPQPTPQQRKKRVLEEVQKQRRRQKNLTLAIIGAILVSLIAGGAYVLAHQSTSNLPPALAQCVSGYGTAYHAHAHLSITIDGSPQNIPSQTGISGGCLHPLHTHSADNVVHIEPDQDQTFTLGDFFLIWGQQFNSTARQFMGHTYAPGKLTMTVTGATNMDFEHYVFPKTAQYVTSTASDTCSGYQQQACTQVDIAITLTTS